LRRFHDNQIDLKKGLRRHYQEKPNNYDLFDLYNFEPTVNGLVPYLPVEEAIPAERITLEGFDTTFPFPQLFIGKRYVILAGRDEIRLVNRDDFTQPFIPLTTYDADNPNSEKSITPGKPWTFVDMQNTWLLTNGVDTVFFSGKETMVGETPKVYVKSGLPIETMTYWKGRVFFGGFDYNQFWNTDWKEFWTKWYTNEDGVGINTGISATRPINEDTPFMPMEENFIWYSLIGGGDVLWLFFPTLAESGYVSSIYGSSKPLLFDLWQRGDQGWMAIDGIGKVRHFHAFQDALIAVLDESIHALFNVQSPAPMIGQRKLYNLGVTAKAFAGDERSFVFIDKGGNLVRIDSDLTVTVEGYKEYLWNIRDTDIVMFHSPDPSDLKGIGKYFICTEHKTFVYNGELFETGQQIKSVSYWKGDTIGITDYYDDGVDEGRICIDIANFLDPGLKQLDAFHVFFKEETIGDSIPTLSLAVDYRYGTREDFSTTPYRLINHNGEVNYPVTSLDFRFRLKVNDYAKIKRIWGFYPVIKFVDRRFKRSTSIDQAGR